MMKPLIQSALFISLILFLVSDLFAKRPFPAKAQSKVERPTGTVGTGTGRLLGLVVVVPAVMWGVSSYNSAQLSVSNSQKVPEKSNLRREFQRTIHTPSSTR